MTGSERFPLLFSPIELGPLSLENRIVFAAHLTNYAEDGLPTERLARYYEARAAGGAGLIVTEEQSVHPTDRSYERLIRAYDPAVVPPYRRVTAAAHRHGTPIFAQLSHNGAQGSSMYSRLPLWAPSPVADPLFREVPLEVGEVEIGEIVAGYAAAARNCREGGFDGIELQCSHSSIVRQFLSPVTNLRTDSYGGSLQGRSRLLLELLAAVHEELGDEMALGVRLCGDELVDGGITIEETVQVAGAVEAQGLADYISTSVGIATESLRLVEASMHVPLGHAHYVPSRIRAAVSLPVLAAGRFKEPQGAEAAIAEGVCDLVGVVRGQIADPDFARKSREGRPESLRLCLSCNQECVGRVGLNRWLGCVENPAAGREAAAAEPPAGAKSLAAARPCVVVVGAGPAGLQAALAAARRGAEVTVLERLERPGGALRLAATAPGRAELAELVGNQLAECRQLGVTIELDVDADAALVLGLPLAAVVVATGAVAETPLWARDPLPAGAPRTADVRELLSRPLGAPGRAVVVDELGFHEATSAAELLAGRGWAVEIVTPALVVGQDLALTTDLEGFAARAAASGIACSTELVVTGLGSGVLELLHHPTGRPEAREADMVVLAVPAAPEEALYRSLVELAPELPIGRAGDCVAPRRAHAAVIEGERAIAELESAGALAVGRRPR